MTAKREPRLWAARILIGVVIAWNLQAAWVFLISPGSVAPAYELAGVAGKAAVRGVAVLFVMWNIPYLVACWHPRRRRVSLLEALAMQFIGVVGESLILSRLGPGHALLAASLLRFIAFDTAGLALLAAAVMLSGN